MSSPGSEPSSFSGSPLSAPDDIEVRAPESLEQMSITVPSPVEKSSNTSSLPQKEDIEMSEAEPSKPASNSPTINANLPTFGTDVIASKKWNLVDTLKKTVYRRDQYLNLLTDMINTDSSDPKDIKHLKEIREKVDDMNKDIHVLRNSVHLSKDKVVIGNSKSSSKVPVGGGIRLNRNDLPKFQLKTSANKYFPKEENFDSVNHFLRSFEKVVSSSGEEIELVWKRYIPLTLHYDLDAWLNNELLACSSWTEAGTLFNKKFGNNAVLKLQSRRQVFNAAMKIGETTEDYTTRFNKAVSEAGYADDNVTIGDAFLMGFPSGWQTQINTLLHCTFVDRDHWSIEEIHTAAVNIFGNQTASISFINNRTRESSSEVGVGSTKRFKTAESSTSSRFAAASSSSSSGQQQPKPKFLGNKNTPHTATGNTFCTWCGKLWVFGHTCPEYYEKNKGKNVRVLTVQSRNKTTGKRNKGKKKTDNENEKLFRESMESSYCFVVGPGVTKIDMRRLSNIDSWPIPKTAKQID
ncbi:hypothetical protein BD408DRAFT_406235 [Parasitella parasitica]|nr:hypothetical protein BD408DRAFT_406235 [Parasitella parasitica]